jgi:K+-transporting ATPase ATPase C chain
MRRQLVPALRMVLVLTVLLGLVYPLAMTGIAQVVFPAKADGSLIERDGDVVGSRLVGQAFTAPEYFHTRPSSAGALAAGSLVDGAPVDPADLAATASGPSNQGPTNPELLASIVERTAAYRADNGLADEVPVPIDAVTASASGVDPHISVANARLQSPRVAEVRGLPIEVVLEAVDDHTDGRALGFLGEPGVNVLELNLALDRLAG